MANETSDRAFWSIDADRLLEQLETSVQGLTQSAVKERLARSSQLKPHRESAWKLLLAQFKSPIIILLFCSAVLSFSLAVHGAWSEGESFKLSDAPDACIIVFILIASGLLGFWQELSAADA